LSWYSIFAKKHDFIFDLLTIIKGLVIYSFLAVAPLNLRMGRSIITVNSFMDKWSYISIIVLVIIIALFVFVARKNKLFLYGLLWFFFPLFIALLFNNFFARRGNEMLLPEHNLYLAYPGLLILFFSIPFKLKTKLDIRKIIIAVLLCIIPIYAVLTIMENNRWQDEIGFYESMIKYNKDSTFNFLAYGNLEYAYEKIEKFQQAEQYFIRAAQSSGGDPYFYNTLATFYLRNGNLDKALSTLNFSKDLDKNFTQIYLLLGIAYMSKGQADKAKLNFEKVVLLDPKNKTAKKFLEAGRK
jgi:tetratricopeptide (TPR) repeat protein